MEVSVGHSLDIFRGTPAGESGVRQVTAAAASVASCPNASTPSRAVTREFLSSLGKAQRQDKIHTFNQPPLPMFQIWQRRALGYPDQRLPKHVQRRGPTAHINSTKHNPSLLPTIPVTSTTPANTNNHTNSNTSKETVASVALPAEEEKLSGRRGSGGTSVSRVTATTTTIAALYHREGEDPSFGTLPMSTVPVSPLLPFSGHPSPFTAAGTHGEVVAVFCAALALYTARGGLGGIVVTHCQPLTPVHKEETTPETEEAKQLELQGVKSAEAGDVAAALASFNKAIEVAPNRASSYNNRAQTLRLMGKVEEAMADLETAVRMSQGQGRAACQAFTQRAMVHRLQGHDDLARADFQEAANLGSEFAKAQLKC
ncbi:Tetratricopeptide repeat protein 36 [Portunus trituberculatus]|uniref:Tetratricopeptide repeat protein 36 n=1 Tax=Portunus trituberculatus TaxID=210409 RepID=A0A5B7CZT0_PORTR|nr:Tetratricopeptide repeat protein 36 [Portunus trituberculatus]